MHLAGQVSSSDTSAKLVKLREAEPVCVFDDHDGRIGHVDTDLDDGRCHEHADLAGAETVHDFLLLGSGQFSVHEPDFVVDENLRLEERRLGFRSGGIRARHVAFVLDADRCELVDVFLVAVAAFLAFGLFPFLANERAHDIDLLSACERFLRSVVGAPFVSEGMHNRLSRCRIARALLDVGKRQVAEQRECERAGDRRCRQEQRIGAFALGQQRGALLDAKSLLLVYDAQRAIREHDVVFEECMGSEQYAGRARCHSLDDVIAFIGRRRAGEDVPADVRLVKQWPKAGCMLACEDLGRCHERCLAACIGSCGQRECGHDGLAGSDVAKQHVVGGFVGSKA